MLKKVSTAIALSAGLMAAPAMAATIKSDIQPGLNLAQATALFDVQYQPLTRRGLDAQIEITSDEGEVFAGTVYIGGNPVATVAGNGFDAAIKVLESDVDNLLPPGGAKGRVAIVPLGNGEVWLVDMRKVTVTPGAPNVVPLPASAILLIGALGALAIARRRRTA